MTTTRTAAAPAGVFASLSSAGLAIRSSNRSFHMLRWVSSA